MNGASIPVQKMNLRQLIILSAMAIVIIYGAYNWFIKTDNRKATGENFMAEDKQVFIGNLTAGLVKNDDSVKKAYSISMAQTTWWHDPFLENVKYAALMKAQETDAATMKDGRISFIYTGFVEIKGKQMAIVNGEEYAEGEKLITNRHILKKIYPDKVIILDLLTMQEMTVPFQE